ncbi:hypothetical protein WR25_08466 isoform F [Diploscapter pachys]|uniref:Mediator of RNA polymerase II transcription subunit 14 n=1 Tax=Diploscapter pachys TaxID=2018661 RepID=A0A2A2L585_9BILA|nr:hypothetical protein WR25_08466 isoform D [Diploscapter pachys]PAV81257.1 hypothetical protein WR25_08466 isoform F [Diploscapter pachys]
MSEEDFSRSLLLSAGKNTPTVSLNYLLEIAIQQVFHEITILSELLGKKQDNEKKISLVQFAHSTRMLFVKLLALVKWVKTSKKFESCTSICCLLDQQSQLFVQTADTLAKYTTVDLLLARLPMFQGHFPRLPQCIKEAFVKKKNINKRDQARVLHRLNTVIERRIAKLASEFSPRIKQISIKNGLTIVVPGEFEFQVAVFGEAETERWLLLNVNMLVDDYEIGFGVDLIHPSQMLLVHQVLQSRINEAQNPIADAYKFLHYYALSAQLDILFCQLTSLISNGRFRDNVIIERYNETEHFLLLGYWIKKPKMRIAVPGVKPVPQYRLQVSFNPRDPDGGLLIRHFPSATGISNFDIGKGQMRIEHVLAETFIIRCKERLLRIRKNLEAEHPKAYIAQTGDTSPTLTLLLCDDEMSCPEEHLVIAVNMFTGRVICSVTCLNVSQRATLRELEKALYDNYNQDTIKRCLNRLKIMVMIERYRRSVTTLQIRIVSENQMLPCLQKVRPIPKDKICLQFIKEEEYYLIITFTAESFSYLQINIYLLWSTDERTQMIEIQPTNRIFSVSYSRLARRNEANVDNIPPVRPIKGSYRDLTCAIASVEERILLKRLGEQLKNKGIPHDLVNQEDAVGGLVVHIKNAQTLIGAHSADFFGNVGRCCLRIDNRVRTSWPLECCMHNIPLVADVDPNRKNPTSCTWVQDVSISGLNPAAGASDSIGDQILDRLDKYCSMYNIVRKFAVAYDKYYRNYTSIEAFTFHKLLLLYGDERDQLMILSFRPKKTTNERFGLNFGQTTPRRILSKVGPMNMNLENRWNPHGLLTSILKDKYELSFRFRENLIFSRLNREGDLIGLVQYLISTSSTLDCLVHFSRVRYQSYKYLPYMTGNEIQFPLKLKSSLHPVTDTDIRLTFGHLNLAILLLSDGAIGIRDASLAKPQVAGLKEFFNLMSGGQTEEMMDDDEQPSTSTGKHASSSPTHPKSLPPPVVCASPQIGSSKSVPPPTGLSTSPAPTRESKELKATYSTLYVDQATLKRACHFEKNACGLYVSPLDDFLSALVYIHRITYALKSVFTSKAPSMITNCQIEESRPDSVGFLQMFNDLNIFQLTLTFSTILKLSTVRCVLFIDPATMKIRLTLEYKGESSPSDESVAVFTDFFERIVYRLNNELAFVAFLNMCKATPTLFESFVAIIKEQQFGLTCPCSVSLNLVYTTSTKDTINKRNNFSGVLIDQNSNQVLIVVRRIFLSKHFQ